MIGRGATLAVVVALAACGNARSDTPDRQRPVRPDRTGPVELRAATAATLCATRGTPGEAEGGADRFVVAEPTFRAVVPASSGEAAELRFVYRGPTDEEVALASGQIRRQLGLKLRAADGCNVVYVMWRLAPQAGLEVSTKRNPGAHTHAECGVRGYAKVKPRRTGRVPRLAAGDAHVLRAELDGDVLTARIDGEVVWEGEVGGAVADLAGPAGMRSDNVQLDAELWVEPPSAAHGAPPGCEAATDS